MAEKEHFDVVVVGAGIAGLAAAKEYLQAAPETNLIIIDENKTLGGVWSADKIYDGLRTNNLRGTLVLPDYPFHDGLGIKHGEHPTGEAMHRYFCEYAEHFKLTNRIRHQTIGLEADKLDGEKESGWKLLVETSGRQYEMKTSKLIVSTGFTSRPMKMHIKGEEDYNAPMIHAGSLGTEAPGIIKDTAIETVTVFGGSKYSFDSVYKFASAGKKIEWVIRKSGHGPTWIPNIISELPILGKVWAERLVTTRFITWLSPCIWAGALDGSWWWRKFLHGTWLGRKIVAGFWANMGSDMLSQTGFKNHPSLKALWPDCEFFDVGTNFAAMNYPTDLLDFVRSGQVKVHREDISHLSDHSVHLTNGTVLKSDAFVASSGWMWKPSLTFKDKSMHADIGVPSTDYSEKQKAFWADLDKKADEKVFRELPMLKSRKYPPRSDLDRGVRPFEDKQQPYYEPQRFYRCIAPPGFAAKGDRTLAFAGFGANITHSIKAELAGLWIYAYFNDLLTIDPARDVKEDGIYWETSLMQRWAFRRHPYGFGQRFPDYIFDAIPWNDVLLNDLGISGCRKGGSWWRECFEPYTVADYQGITAEWLAKRKGKRT